jgi:hypothetical protein
VMFFGLNMWQQMESVEGLDNFSWGQPGRG